MTGAASRGVSDLVGFAIVFGIVVLSISLVYTFGVGALTDVQEGEAMDNAERGFDIFADNLDDIQLDGAPGRSTELDFAEGVLSVNGQVSMTVRDPDNNLTVVLVATPVSYTNDGRGFHYASGAVVRTFDTSVVMTREPAFRFSEERVVISFVETRLVGDTSSIGGGFVRVSARRVGVPSVRAIELGDVTFNVSVTSPRHEAWEAYFEQQGCQSVNPDPANDTVTCAYETDELYVRQTLVDVRLSR